MLFRIIRHLAKKVNLAFYNHITKAATVSRLLFGFVIYTYFFKCSNAGSEEERMKFIV